MAVELAREAPRLVFCHIEPASPRPLPPQAIEPAKGYLHNEPCCVYCLRTERRTTNRFITLDHIVLQEACDDYPASLKRLKHQPVNHLTVCANGHLDIDHNLPNSEGSAATHPKNRKSSFPMGKAFVYKTEGVPGLVRYIASYPRPPQEDYYFRHYNQLLDLFSSLEDCLDIQIRRWQKEMAYLKGVPILTREERTFRKAREHVLRGKIEDFNQTGEFVVNTIHQWERGDF